MFENVDVWTVVTIVLGAIAALFGTFWGKVKGKLGQVVIAGKEFADVGIALKDALEDDKITQEEKENIKKEWGEALAAFKKLIGKEPAA